LSEVKSQNDHLSDHQRFWIHTLVTAGAKVDVCHVVEKLPKKKVEK
jgi:Fanconi-associated nuclease 1